MLIAICDDELSALKQTSETVRKVLKEIEIKYIIHEFSDETELLKGKINYDIIFLDIELNGRDRNGVGVAKELKQRNPGGVIIFVTNYEEYIDDVIEKYAFRYWSKPIDEYRLRKSIRLIVERMQTIKVEIHDTKQMLELPMRDIIYITTQSKHCKIVTINGEYITAESFKSLRAKLSTQNFCGCHGSYCVNLSYVKKYTKSMVYMCYEDKKYEVHMSRRQYGDFKEQMFIVGGESV